MYKKIIFLIGTLLLFAITGCANDKNQPTETGASDDELIPVEIAGIEPVPDEETTPKEYDNWADAYLDVLIENRPALTDERLDDITPFEESCMTYAEAVAWLEEQ